MSAGRHRTSDRARRCGSRDLPPLPGEEVRPLARARRERTARPLLPPRHQSRPHPRGHRRPGGGAARRQTKHGPARLAAELQRLHGVTLAPVPAPARTDTRTSIRRSTTTPGSPTPRPWTMRRPSPRSPSGTRPFPPSPPTASHRSAAASPTTARATGLRPGLTPSPRPVRSTSGPGCTRRDQSSTTPTRRLAATAHRALGTAAFAARPCKGPQTAGRGRRGRLAQTG